MRILALDAALARCAAAVVVDGEGKIVAANALAGTVPRSLHASPAQRRWIRAELAANGAWLALVFGLIKAPWLEYHVAAMAIGQCLTAFFAVWTVHHDCDAEPARTIRHRVKAMATYNMFYHLEHHQFPAVPTCKPSPEKIRHRSSSE